MRDAPDVPDRPFTRADLEELGITPAELRRAIRAGQVRRLLRGVFVSVEVPDSLELRIQAARLVVAPGQVACDRTAAWIHGIDVLTYAEHDVLPPVETCALRWRPPTRRDGVLGRTRDLSPGDVMCVGGLHVTTPLRTALDLGCNLRRREAMAALDAFARVHGLDREQLQTEAIRYFRRRGVVQLRQLIPLADPRAESARESWTRIAIIDAGLPCPEPQFWIEIGGVPTYRLDLAYPRHRIVIEYDGEQFHDRTEEQKQHDRERRAWLHRNGWTVIVVRNGDFSGPALDRWLRQLRDALRSTYSNLRW